jgi:DNA-binding PucR family transcriptional regulator
MAWERPSPRVAELFKEGIQRLLERGPEEFLAKVDAASLTAHSPVLAEDPTLLATFRRANRATIMHWAEGNLRDPGGPITPYVGPESQALVHDLVRRGLDMQALEPYRAGQNAAWNAWMDVAFELTDDAGELQELLEVSARSIFSYVDASMAATVELVTSEREKLMLGTSAERLETLTLILDEAPIDLERAQRRLGYVFDRTHQAAIVWSDDETTPEDALEHVAAGLATAYGAERALTAAASRSSLWAWVVVHEEPAPETIEALVEADGPTRIALGTPAGGLDGFRRSHAGAFAAQSLIGRLGSPLRVVRYADLQVVSLVTQDEERARRFVSETLGELEQGPPALRETLRTYLRSQSNATRAAEALFAHRNTIVARLAKAEELLPRPLADSALDVAVALEVLHWSEAGGGPAGT